MISKNILVIAPHPDDETLGCGGTLLTLKSEGYHINWLIGTSIFEKEGYSKKQCDLRADEVKLVAQKYGFEKVVCLDIPTTKVDLLGKSELINMITLVLKEIQPNILFIPYYNDVHTDHQLISEATISCAKWFRYPFVKTVLFYEVISETDANINSTLKTFKPNIFVDITEQIEKKIEIMKIYESEIQEYPFPRSERAIRSLSDLRGTQCGASSAEAFELLTMRLNIKEVVF